MRRPTPTPPPASAGSPATRRGADAAISPLGVVVCILATLVAIPVLLAGRAEGEGDQLVAAAATEATHSSLIVETESADMFDAGAQDGEAEELRAASAALAVETVDGGLTLEEQAALDAMNAAIQSAAAAGAVAAATSTTAPATTAAPTTTAPATTAAPTTAAPTTAAPTTAAPTTAAPTTTEAPTASETVDTTEPVATTEPPSGEPTAEQWSQLRQCESSGNYQIVSSNGLYYGAYQFSRRTWDDLARRVGRSDLDGLPPNQASNADQDAMALALWRERGPQPWPVCGRFLPPLP